MRVCVIGAGAIGGLVAARLALAGADVRVVARGAHLEAIRARGLSLTDASGTRVVRVEAAADPASLGPQDVVVTGLKAMQLPAAADGVARLLGPETVLVPALNGIPWWHGHGDAAPAFAGPLEAVDPGGTLWRTLPPERVVGCVVYLASSVRAPGEIVHAAENRLVLGEPDGRDTPRLAAVAGAFAAAGFEVRSTGRIRDALWTKLLGNASFNPLSCLTLAPVDRMMADPGVKAAGVAIMRELTAVAEAVGVRIEVDIPTRLSAAGRLGAFRTSMLQDLEARRPLELDAILGGPIAIARRAGVPVPMTEAVEAMTRQLAVSLGLRSPD
jgi:2-dehydropantoate 2-reductase